MKDISYFSIFFHLLLIFLKIKNKFILIATLSKWVYYAQLLVDFFLYIKIFDLSFNDC